MPTGRRASGGALPPAMMDLSLIPRTNSGCVAVPMTMPRPNAKKASPVSPSVLRVSSGLKTRVTHKLYSVRKVKGMALKNR